MEAVMCTAAYIGSTYTSAKQYLQVQANMDGSQCVYGIVYRQAHPLKAARCFHRNDWWHIDIRKIGHFIGHAGHPRMEIIF